MKFALPQVVIFGVLLSGCTAFAKLPKVGKEIVVRTTAYTHTEAGGRKNAVDGKLRFGRGIYSAAADWSWLPLGTRFRMCSTGRDYVIEDYGAALVGKQTIDLYLPTRREMNAWGVRPAKIIILKWGSRALSLKLLKTRLRSAHVRRMVQGLLRQ